MRLSPIGPALLAALAACSAPSGSDADATSTPSPAPTAADTAIATPADAAATEPGEIRTFKDWTVACDNVKQCQMASLGPEAGDWPELTMEVTRAAGPAGAWSVALYTQRDASPVPVAAVIDGARYPVNGDTATGEAAARLVAALPNARALTIVDANGATLARYSPAGLSASLRYIDAEQGRAGTRTALVAKGDRPDDAVPPAPRAPTVPAMALAAGAKPSAAQIAEMNRVAQCELPDAFDAEPEVARAGNATLVVLPCSAGAYNVIGALFVIRDGKVSPASTDAPTGFDETGADSQTPVRSVVNGAFADGRLTSYAKGRGLGDCGVSQSLAWDGERYRLVEQRAMGECRGNPNYLRTFTAATSP